MSYIKGKYKTSIFEATSGYKVGLFKVQETDDKEIEENKTLTFTGYFTELNNEDTYILYGNYIFHDRYGYQFSVTNYEKIMPTGKDAIIDFLSSSYVKGCGEATAKSIYKVFKNESLNKIKESKDNLLLVPKMTEKKATSIYNSVCKYFEKDEEIIKLKNMGFSIKETMALINIYGEQTLNIIEKDIYNLLVKIDFKKLDRIFLNNNDKEDPRRIKACIIQSMKNLSFALGDIYLSKEEITKYTNEQYKINTDLTPYFEELFDIKKIMIQEDKYYLIEDYLDELYIAKNIPYLMTKSKLNLKNFDNVIKECEEYLHITYNEDQKNAIWTSLSNNISIITGGPGTGKTTIIEGIINAYAIINKLNNHGIDRHLLLLAPTGRASKRMSETSGYGASTIHRFLKWDKENNIFGINELNQLHYNLIIIDETSMIDNHLFASLLKGLDLTNTQIILVGDEYQLPSVGPGIILSDLIKSNIPHISLEQIYRQSDNSYIPELAKNIKNSNIDASIKTKRDDFSFIECPKEDIKKVMIKVLEKMNDKKVPENAIQILAPMYKGENGIDNLNITLQEFFNPDDNQKAEAIIGPITYREGDKVLNLVNDVDNNIYNGDIGYIDSINLNSKKDFIIVNYEGNYVSYKKEDINTITHAYAISIHKSQGSEFGYVIMPISLSYSRMLYNKLLYTGVSRSKKSLILIGSLEAFNQSIYNNYSYQRKTTLTEKIMNNLKD